ncbi:MAG: CRTAC1 family protein [Planctomycetes bacterium]|nr:CRTAC1 family protein [Planctomycetota bacterium]
MKFHTVCGGKEKDYVLEVNGCGVVLLDYDNDGKLDIFLVNGSKLPPPYGEGPGSPPPSDALFRNLGGMSFENVTQTAGLTESAWGCGAAAGDYDNDGDPDIFVTNYGPDCLWQNHGNGTFTDVTAQAGVGDPGWGSSCAFLDYDRDGFLDLFIVNYVEFNPANVKRRGTDPTCQYKGQPILCGPVGLPTAPCTLYRNRGNGTFEEVSARSGIRAVKPSYGLGVTVIDFDDDGWLDIYVANDTLPNLLFRNKGDGTFEEVGMSSGVALNDHALAQAGMGTDAVFLREGAREDLFVVNYEDDNNTFYRNDGNGFFTEITSAIGLAEPCFKHLGWGTFFFDPDLDGKLDLFIAQGHVVPQADQIPSSPGWKQFNKLFLNDGAGRFIDISSRAGPGLEVKKSSRGAACGDLDGDGDLDIVVNEIDDEATVLENAGSPKNHWVAVRPLGTASNRDGIGAVVIVRAGGKEQKRRVRSGSSYASQSELTARFGLGEARKVDELRVRWPTGKEERYPPPPIDQKVEVVEGKGSIP